MGNGSLGKASIAAAPRGAEPAAKQASDGEFIAKLGHELRTPLTAILGYAEILKTHAKPHLPQEQFHQLEIIERAGHAMLRLITAVLDWSRLEAGKVKVEPQRFDPAATLREFADTMVIMAAAKGLQFSLELNPPAPAPFCTDPHLLRQIFTNLVTNAVKYTERGGVIVTVERGPDQLTLSVADTGPGIPEPHQSVLFQEFQRLSQTDREGTGLGLAITRGLVELLGGRILVKSRTGEGSRFTVVLPELPAELPAESPPPLPFPAMKRSAKVVLFDDEPDNRDLLKLYLEQDGMTVSTFESAVDCVITVLAERPDVVLLDMMMPDVDGFEAARRLRACEATREIPIIALTALADGDTNAKALAAGCNLCLIKPLDFRLLTAALQQCLNGSPQTAK